MTKRPDYSQLDLLRVSRWNSTQLSTGLAACVSRPAKECSPSTAASSCAVPWAMTLFLEGRLDPARALQPSASPSSHSLDCTRLFVALCRGRGHQTLSLPSASDRSTSHSPPPYHQP